MEKKEIITICGGLGSGKSSTAKMVAQKLGYKHFSSGDLFRQVGLELRLSVTELNKSAESNPALVDEQVDRKLRDLGQENKLVIDSRTAYHWIPTSFKVYLDLPPEIAKHRVIASLQENPLRMQSEQVSTPEEAYTKMIERFESEQKRFQDLYQINNKDRNNFDLIIDTNQNNLEQVVSEVIEKYKQWREN